MERLREARRKRRMERVGACDIEGKVTRVGASERGSERVSTSNVEGEDTTAKADKRNDKTGLFFRKAEDDHGVEDWFNRFAVRQARSVSLIITFHVLFAVIGVVGHADVVIDQGQSD